MKSTGGFVLSLIGGILNVLLGFVFIVFWLLLIIVVNSIDIKGSLASFGSISAIIFLSLGGLFVVLGILMIVFSLSINSDDDYKVKKSSIWCLVLGILNLNLLTIVGGIMGIVASSKMHPVGYSPNSFIQNYQNI